MHQLSSAEDDAARWEITAETDDVTIRTGAVTAMRKARFEGGEVFAVSEEQSILNSLRASSSTSANVRRRDLLQTNIPDRTHLVREAARMLWVSITWHLELLTPPAPLGEPIDDSSWTTRLGSIDEAHLPDGEASALPVGAKLSSISTHFFQLLSASTTFLLRHKQALSNDSSMGAHLLGVVSEWNQVGESYLARMREQVVGSAAMLSHFSHLIHHWTRIRLLRPYLGQLEESASLSEAREILIGSCKDALLQVQKIIATSDVDLSIFQPVVAAVKVDATLILALHLLARAGLNDSNTGDQWNEVRKLVKTSLLLMWTHAAEASQHRLGDFKAWRKQTRQLVEELLIAAFERKKVALEQQPRIKNEDGELPTVAGLDEDDRLDSTVGPLAEEVPLKVYRDQLLANDPIYRQPLFFDVLDSYLRTL